ncbi:MAG: PASTA domain-containing protein, partial [Caryophanon sp.]|nr:PASTA domain-containing protein [Caryophanon sp.]
IYRIRTGTRAHPVCFSMYVHLCAEPGMMKPAKVAVPDVVNLPVEEAIELLEEQGFTIGEERERTSNTVEEDHVIDTSPAAGKEVEPQSEIDLIVSTGVEKTSVANYVGQNVDQVMNILKDRSYSGVSIDEEYSREREGTVLAQSPVAGEQVIESETRLTLTVSKGSNTAQVADLTGYGQSALEQYARSSGFNINVSREEHSDTVEAGDVISQTPSAGSSLEVGSTINVVRSKGPEAKDMKTFVQVISIPYEPDIEPVEETVTDEDGADSEAVDEDVVEEPIVVSQHIRIYVQDQKNTMAKPVEEFDITETTSHRIRLEIEEDSEAAYRIVRDNEVIIEETILYEDL